MAGKESLLDDLSGWASDTTDLLNDPELRDGWNNLTRSVQEAAEKGIAAWEKHKPELEAKAQEFYEWVLREAPEWAAQIRRAIDRLLQQVEDDLRNKQA